MKIERLTDNKIRVIVNFSDLKENNLNIQTLFKKEVRGENFFLDMLKRAKKEVGFNTEGYKLLIEAFSGTEDNFILTITKYKTSDNQEFENYFQKIIVKRKLPKNPTKQAIYKFNNFDEYCDFCNCLNHNLNFDFKTFSTDISLYLFKKNYYLVVKNINSNYKYSKSFYSLVSEFSVPLNYSSIFENKLIEYGKSLITKKSFLLYMQYFNKNKPLF